ncbi:MAG: hypothetical protein BAJATHORv1_10475 [Candidatus Thorarchaeota archaeon]|nr:MAG: hypothetical protein BAJATHORv1_10475 [Candidatus Thorarchaeota archaeon]
MLRRLLGRDKEDEEKKEEEKEAAEEAEEADLETEEAEGAESATDAAPSEESESASEEDVPAEKVVTPISERGGTIPYHDSIIDRLKYMFNDSTICDCLEGPDEFRIEFMAMGERFHVSKPSNDEVEFGSGPVSDEDVFIRISNDVVKELLNAATFSEFTDIYMQYYKNSEPGKFVKIELRKPIGQLNRNGYARVPILKLLVGTIR